MARQLPYSTKAYVIRTEYSMQEIWKKLLVDMLAPTRDYGNTTAVEIIDDPKYQDMTIEALIKIMSEDQTYFFVVDKITLSHPEHPIVCVDLYDESGEYFRVVPSEFVILDINLNMANMDFTDFSESADEDGIFRGFD